MWCILLQVVQLVGGNPALLTCGWSDVVYIVTGCTAGGWEPSPADLWVE